jgi:hypothetical protein
MANDTTSAILCSYLQRFIIFGLSCTLFGWGCAVLTDYSRFEGECGSLWTFLLFNTIVSGTSIAYQVFEFFCGTKEEDARKKISCTQWLIFTASLASTIWIFILWEHKITGDCKTFYDDHAHGMYFYFVFLFWLTVSSLSLLGCVCCCACGAMATGQTSDDVQSQLNNLV